MPALLACLTYVDPHFSAWPANTVEEEHVHFQGGDLLLLVSLKAALWK